MMAAFALGRSARSGTRVRPGGVWGIVCVLLSLAASIAVALPERGSDGPVIRLTNLDGGQVSSKDLAPKVLVVVFGELGHEGAKRACADVLDVLQGPSIDKASVDSLLIVAQPGTTAQLKELAAAGRYPASILRDEQREAFGAYRILVVPSVVVLDGRGKVAYAMPGFVPRFKEILLGAVRCAQGTLTREQLDALIADEGDAGERAEDVRAARLVHLGHELARHGMLDAAEERFAEAVRLAPENLGAKSALAEVLLREGKAGDAEPIFRAILAKQPESSEASLGLAAAKITLGAEADLAEATTLVRGILSKNDKNARAHLLMGRLLEGGNDCPAALAEYRRAAELYFLSKAHTPEAP